MSQTVDQVFRDSVVAGVPSSGKHEPVKSEIRTLLKRIEGATTAGIVVRQTKAALLLVTPDDENAGAWVLNDPTASNNGYWYRDAGAWVWGRGFPDSNAVLENIAGTANAITADLADGVDPADVQMIILGNPPDTNSSATVTIALNGATAESVKAASGAALAIGDIIAGVGTVFFRSGTEWRQLVSSATGATFDHQGTWAAPTTYTEAQVVTGSDGNWYQLKVPSATGDDPVSGGSGDWLLVLVGAVIADKAITEPKFADTLTLKMAKICYSLSELRAVDTTRYNIAYLAVAGREGIFAWDGADLSSEMVVKSSAVSSVDEVANTFRMREVVTSTFSATTNTFTSAGHGFVALQQVIIPTTRNALQGGGLYYIGSDVTADTFRLYTSVGTATAAGTSGLAQIGVVSTSVSGNTIAKILHRWTEGTIVRPTAAVNGLSTTTDYYIKVVNVNGVELSLTEGGAAVTLTGTDEVTLYQPGDMTIREPHDMYTGQTLAVDLAIDGMLANTPYSFIATDQCYGQIASSFANAKDGAAFDLTAATAFTFRHLLDPKQARYVVRTSDRITGEDGAWKRSEIEVKAAHWGIVADDGTTDNSEAVQNAIWFATYSGKREVLFDSYAEKIGLKYEVGNYTHTNLSIAGVSNPGNGVIIRGKGSDATRFCRTADSANAHRLVMLDGNFWGVAVVVGSNPMAQGLNRLEGIALVGHGQSAGGTLSGLGLRGAYGFEMSDVTIEQFPQHGIYVTSGINTASGNADDDVDGTTHLDLTHVKILRNGRNGMFSPDARTAVITCQNCTFQSNLWSGVDGCFVYAQFNNCNCSSNGSRSVPTSGGYRFYGSISGAICRLVSIDGGVCEANFNHEIAFNACLSVSMRDIGFNLYAPSDAATNGLGSAQAAIKMRASSKSWVVEKCKFTANTTSYGDIVCIDVESAANHGRVTVPNFAGTTSHLKLQSGIDVVVSGSNQTLSYTTSGNPPSECYNNFTALT